MWASCIPRVIFGSSSAGGSDFRWRGVLLIVYRVSFWVLPQGIWVVDNIRWLSVRLHCVHVESRQISRVPSKGIVRTSSRCVGPRILFPNCASGIATPFCSEAGNTLNHTGQGGLQPHPLRPTLHRLYGDTSTVDCSVSLLRCTRRISSQILIKPRLIMRPCYDRYAYL